MSLYFRRLRAVFDLDLSGVEVRDGVVYLDLLVGEERSRVGVPMGRWHDFVHALEADSEGWNLGQGDKSRILIDERGRVWELRPAFKLPQGDVL